MSQEHPYVFLRLTSSQCECCRTQRTGRAEPSGRHHSLDELPWGNGISLFFLSHCTRVLLVLRVWIFCVNRILRLSVDLQLQLPAGAAAALIPREWFWAYSAPPASMLCSVPQARVCGYRTKHGVQQPIWAQPSWALKGHIANTD